MQKTLFCSIVFLGFAGSLFADQFEGTWKFNMSKSKPAAAPQGMGVKEQTMVIVESGGQATVTFKGTRDNGSAISTKYSTPVNGGPVEYTEGGPPAGVTVATRRVNALTVDFTNTRDGKVVGTNHVTISKDGKTMTLHVKGADAKGNPVESLIVFDRQ